jgi:hypothetical protein
MAVEELADLIDQLSPDPGRLERPFSSDIQECHHELFDPSKTRLEIELSIRKWLRTSPNQPCLFGRIAASEDDISFCILKQGDIERGETYIREVIQSQRRIWKFDALNGRKHGFIIILVSESMAWALPDQKLLRVAQRLCDLYLFDQATEPKRHDALSMRLDGGEGIRWLVGVNVFAAQADGRWWNDHRIPGGLAFSMNSVGHMTFARRLRKFPQLGDEPTDALLNWALPTAMRTIDTASKRKHGGSRLMERERALSCPAVPPDIRASIFQDINPDVRSRALRNLAGFSEHLYEGWYDTDESIPEQYFTPDWERPVGSDMLPLYFTYLHSYRDADYETMGLGEQLFAEAGEGGTALAESEESSK